MDASSVKPENGNGVVDRSSAVGKAPVEARYVVSPLQGLGKRGEGTPEAMPQAGMRGAVGAGRWGGGLLACESGSGEGAGYEERDPRVRDRLALWVTCERRRWRQHSAQQEVVP